MKQQLAAAAAALLDIILEAIPYYFLNLTFDEIVYRLKNKK